MRLSHGLDMWRRGPETETPRTLAGGQAMAETDVGTQGLQRTAFLLLMALIVYVWAVGG